MNHNMGLFLIHSVAVPLNSSVSCFTIMAKGGSSMDCSTAKGEFVYERAVPSIRWPESQQFKVDEKFDWISALEDIAPASPNTLECRNVKELVIGHSEAASIPPAGQNPVMPSSIHVRKKMSMLALKKARDWRQRVQRLSHAICRLDEREFVYTILESWTEQLTPTDLCFVVKQVGSTHWQRALELYECVNMSKWYTPNPRMLTTILSVLGRAQQSSLAEELFERAEPELGECVQVYNTMMGLYARHGEWEKMQLLYGQMQQKGCQPDLVTYNILVNAQTKAGLQPGMAVSLLEGIHEAGLRPDAITYNTLISACSSQNRWAEAEEIFDEMRRQHCEPDIWTYNAMISVYGRSGAVEAAKHIFTSMQVKGFDPDAVTYNSMLYAFAKAGRIDEVDQIRKKMLASDCHADEITYNTMIYMYGKAGLHHEAAATYSQMKSNRCHPDVVTFTVLIDALGKEGLVQEASNVYVEMVEKGIQPSLQAYSAMICAYAKAGLYLQADQTYRCMQESAVCPDVLAYSVMLDVYHKAEMPEKALQVYTSLMEAGCKPELRIFGIVFQLFYKKRMQMQLDLLGKDMVQSGFEPTELCSYLARNGLCDESLASLELALNQGFALTEEVIKDLLSSFAIARRYEDAREAVYVLAQLVPQRSILLYEALLLVLAKGEKFEEAQEELSKLKGRGQAVTFSIYKALIIAYEQAGMFDAALQVASDMYDSGLRPDIHCYKSAAMIYCLRGQPELAYNLLQNAMHALGEVKTSTIHIAIIESYGKLRQWQDAEIVFKEISQAGLPLCLKSYNALLLAYAESGKHNLAESTFDHILTSGFAPTVTSANFVLEAISNAEIVQDLDRFHKKMLKSGINPNLKTFCIMLNAFAKMGNQEEACRVYHHIKSLGFYPNMKVYKIMVSLFSKEANAKDAELILTDMKESGYEPDIAIYNSMISLYSKRQSYKSAAQVFQGMQAVGCLPDSMTFNTLICLYSRHLMVQEAYTLFQRMQKEGHLPDISTYTSLIAACGHLHLSEFATLLFKQMQDTGCKPDVTAFSVMLNVYRRAGNHQQAEVLVREMKDAGIHPTKETFHMLMDCYGKGGETLGAESTFESIKHAGIQPGVMHFTSLINAYLKSGEYDAAVDKLKHMTEAGIEANPVTITCFISAASTCQTLKHALVLLAGLQSVGISLPYRLLMERNTQVLKDAAIYFEQLQAEGGDAGKGIVNVLLDLLWAFWMRATAARIFNLALQKKIYAHDISRVQDKDWGADFRTLSPGAALVALTLWLDEMQNAALQGAPESSKSVLLVMGGSKRKNQASVSKTLKMHLWEMGSPFLSSKTREGILIAKGHSLRMWLKDSPYCMDLELRDILMLPKENSMQVNNGTFMRAEMIPVVKQIEGSMGTVHSKKFCRLVHLPDDKRADIIAADIKGRAEKFAKQKLRLETSKSILRPRERKLLHKLA
ncbi:hypothetical protein O6H91_20G044800 [Diphasiastrum complanatum]|uniref:Uncharacterized protein n=2 Tax=Diphasiastrum complanatum TaxID=34168 RepID=A0ACC2APV3_DIPCM|nr:hypothetical protein O6H91_20G044800 [Diphasiastrum complanatum]KAJ7519581.1 hypothetical protein O6H91_20G044800 [Diphasiastrum complanatum]